MFLSVEVTSQANGKRRVAKLTNSMPAWLADWRSLVNHFIYLQSLDIGSQTVLYLQTPPGYLRRADFLMYFPVSRSIPAIDAKYWAAPCMREEQA